MRLNDELNLNVFLNQQETSKPVAVLIHGDDQNHTVWSHIKDYFYEKGHSTVCYDLPGHGLSDIYKHKDYSYQLFAQTLGGVLNQLEISDFILIGNSTGGIIALTYAIQKPLGLKGLVAISSCDENPINHLPDITESEIEKTNNRLIRSRYRKSKKSFQAQEVFDYSNQDLSVIQLIEMKYTHPEAIQGNLIALTNLDIRLDLGKINVPVLYIWGSEDKIIENEWMERINNETPKSRSMIINGYSHNILLEDPGKIIECIDKSYRFLMQEYSVKPLL